MARVWENTAFLFSKGSALAFSLSFIPIVGLYYLSDKPILDLGLALSFLFIWAILYFVASFLLWLVFKDKWPWLHFDNILSDLDPKPMVSTEENSEDYNPYTNESPAIQEAWRIMTEARKESEKKVN